MRKAWLGSVALSAVGLLFLTGCAQRAPVGRANPCSTESASEGSFANELGVDWDDPINGIAVSSPGSVQKDFAFPLLIPRGLGSPIGMYETDPSGVAEADRVMEFVYDTDCYGRVVIEEHLPDMPAEGWKADADRLVAMNDDPMTHGTATLLAVRDGNDALTTTSEDGSVSDLRWLQDGKFEVLVRGPTLSPEQCVAIADGL